MRYDYRYDDGTVHTHEFPMGEAPQEFLTENSATAVRVYGVPEFAFDGGRSAFHNSTLEEDRRHQRWCLQDAGVPDEAIQPAWNKDYAGPV